MWGDATYRDFHDAMSSKETQPDFRLNFQRYDTLFLSHIIKIIIIVYKINFELIDRYFAEEHPQGQEIAFDKESQLLEDDYRYIIGMGNIHV